MRGSSKKLTSRERKVMIEKVVTDCQLLASGYIKTWKPLNSTWETVEGCAYLRLSDDEQVLVEKGSLEQQINIAVSEAINRSETDKINYKITKFYIEPGITGTHDKRPQFQMMKRQIKRRVHNFIVIKEIARLVRDALLWKELFKLCIESECELFIRGLPFNPNDPTQVLQLDFLAMLAEYESKLTSKRLKESVFAAMITSGKFNSTHKILGLDQLVINGEPKVGLYTSNKKELKAVTWIMQTFVRYKDYKQTYEECTKRLIFNKNGEPFKKTSIKSLLTNTKYIGRWVVNEINKNKRPNKLMAYQKYEEVELPHGEVIDRSLWEEVQNVVCEITGRKTTAKHFRRVYPLKGLIQFNDGTSFSGNGAWGKTSRVNYYWNKSHNIRMPAEVVEAETRKIVVEIIQRSPKLRESIRKWSTQVKTTSQILDEQAAEIHLEISRIEGERIKLDRRLDFLLEDGSEAKAIKFKGRYEENTNRLDRDLAKCKTALAAIKSRNDNFTGKGFDWKDLSDKASMVQEIILENDPAALRVAYQKLFESIVVGDLDKSGVRTLTFNLRGGVEDFDKKNAAFEAAVNLVEKNCINEKLAR